MTALNSTHSISRNRDEKSETSKRLEERLTERFGILLSQKQLAELLDRTPGGLRYSLCHPTELIGLASAGNGAVQRELKRLVESGLVPKPFKDRIMLAALYGSVAKHKDTAASDIDLLVVSDELTLEQLYTALAPAEDELARKINPSLYTSKEFDRRKRTGSGFLSWVLAGEHIVLMGEEGAA